MSGHFVLLRCCAALVVVKLLVAQWCVAAEPVVHVVLPDQPMECVRLAGDELETYLPKSTGSSVIRLKASAWKATQRPAIVVGIAPKGVVMKPFQRDAYAIVAQDDVLFIWGNDGEAPIESSAPKGSLYGVYDYLKIECGVRWLFPGPQGEVIPTPTTSLKIRGISRASAPDFEQRLLSTGSWLDASPETLKALNRDPDFDQRLLRWHRVWMLRNRLQTRRIVDANHAFVDWWEKSSREHPSWFAQQRDGKRVLLGKPHTVKLCTTNQEVIRATVQQGLERSSPNPWMKSISASPNDSALTGYCMCPDCKRLDARNAPEVELRDRQGTFLYPALTDRHVVFWNDVAKELNKTNPNLLVGGYAYGCHHSPPVREKPLPNVLIGFVQHASCYWDIEAFKAERECFDGWAKTGVTMLWRPNSLQMGHGVPSNFLWRMSHDLQYVNRRGAKYASYDTLGPHWGSLGHTYYFLAELLWDTDKSVKDLWADYLQAGYGPAKDTMKAYFAELDAISEELFRSGKVDAAAWRQGGEAAAARVYPGAHWARLKQLLAEAKKQSANYEFGLRMLAMNQDALEFFEHQLEVNRLLYDGPRPLNFQQGPLAKAIAARDEWLCKHPKSLGISSVEMANTASLMQKVADKYQPQPRGRLEVNE